MLNNQLTIKPIQHYTYIVNIYVVPMKIALAILTLTFSTSVVLSQNLVGNGDFEVYSSLPNSSGDWSFCTGWNNVNLSMSAWPYATPDYFHTSGTGGGNSPNTSFGTCLPHSGNAFIGLYSKHSSQLNSRDYMSRQLNSPLVVGQTYTISFWMSSGTGNYYYGSSCSGMGVQLTMAPLYQANHENTGGIPQAEVPGAPWIPNWTFYSFTYVATSPFQYVTVGNFYTDAATTTVNHASANYPTAAYYFIDELIIETASVLPIELISFDVINDDESVLINWSTNVEINNDYIEIERSYDAENWEFLSYVDGAGNSESRIDYRSIDSNPGTGTIYYRLKQVDYNGEEHLSDVKSVRRLAKEDINLYPNPANEFVIIEQNDIHTKDLILLDMHGKNVTSLTERFDIPNQPLTRITIEQLPKGTYVIMIDGKTERLIKQ